ncbi:hypothetical protein K1719_009511 [Acacia pycnantha]|nr:hypothetical protein K1719_009511 [Acacia pycnantha]
MIHVLPPDPFRQIRSSSSSLLCFRSVRSSQLCCRSAYQVEDSTGTQILIPIIGGIIELFSAKILLPFHQKSCSHSFRYITSSKEDEAIQSIQSVHGFVLEGQVSEPQNIVMDGFYMLFKNHNFDHCTTLDYLYLHEVGSEEYSFTKYDVISAYTSMGARDLAIKNFMVQFTYAGFTNIIHNIHVQTTRGGFKIDFLGLILILLVADDCWSIATRNSKAN